MKNATQARLRLASLGGHVIDGGKEEPRKYAQSTSGRRSSQRTTPRLSRSKAIASDSPKRPLVDSFLRMYPIEVPERLAKRCCSEGGRELTYSRSDSMGNYSLPPGTVPSSLTGNWPSSTAAYVADMRNRKAELEKLYAVRRRRLSQLVDEYGSQAELARTLSRSNLAVLANESYLSRLLSGKPRTEGGKNIGGDTAAEIERLTKKPTGWLSRENDDELIPLVEAKVWNLLTSEEKLQLRGTMDAMITGFMADQRRRRKLG
jgi:hypothetical protein